MSGLEKSKSDFMSTALIFPLSNTSSLYMHNHASNVNETREQQQDVDGLSLPEPLLESGQNRI